MLVKFACYFPAETPLFMVIKIDSNAWVVELSKEITVELHSRGRKDVKIDDLRFFRVSLSFAGAKPTNIQQTDLPLEPEETLQPRALQWLHQQPVDGQLKETKNLSFIFPKGPDLSYDRLDIIVADAEGMLDFVL
jgi:hypothetical protein